MTTMAEMVDKVIELTKRPDLEQRTKSMVQSATLTVHNADFYYRDLSEHGIMFTEKKFNQNWEPKTIYPLFRKIKYIRQWNYEATDLINAGTPGPMYECIDLGQEFDQYGYQKTNIYYMAGDLIQIKARCEQDHFLTAAYSYPDVTLDGYKSWIADEQPFAIIFTAAKLVAASIGFREDAQNYAALAAQEQLNLVRYSDNMPGR